MNDRGEATAKCDEVGIDAICDRIESGESQSEIAASLGVSAAALNRWLHREEQRSARARAAMEVSAESSLDRGMAALLESPPDHAEISRPKAIEQHCARRAAIRNPEVYGDEQQVAHSVNEDTAAILLSARKRSGIEKS